MFKVRLKEISLHRQKSLVLSCFLDYSFFLLFVGLGGRFRSSRLQSSGCALRTLLGAGRAEVELIPFGKLTLLYGPDWALLGRIDIKLVLVFFGLLTHLLVRVDSLGTTILHFHRLRLRSRLLNLLLDNDVAALLAVIHHEEAFGLELLALFIIPDDKRQIFSKLDLNEDILPLLVLFRVGLVLRPFFFGHR